MIVFLYGRDSYRLKQNLDKIVEEYKNKHPIGASFVFDLTEHGEGAKFGDSLKSVSFFDEKKLLTIKNPFAAAEMTTELINRFNLDKDKQTIVIFIEPKDEGELVKKDRELWGALAAKSNLVKKFELLEGKKLDNWITKEAVVLGCSIQSPAIKRLISRTTVAGDKNQNYGDTGRLHLELQKLTNYKHVSGSNQEIEVNDVDLLIPFAEDLNMFELVDAVANRARVRAASLLHENLESGRDPFYIFSMLAYQFRNLARVKSLMENSVPYQSIVSETGLNPFVVKKTYEQSKKYSLNELKTFFGRLAQIDIDMKSGFVGPEDALFQFIFSLAI